MSGCTFALLGCGVVALLLMVAIGIGIWYVTNNFRTIRRASSPTSRRNRCSRI
jgi:hypothetical protein